MIGTLIIEAWRDEAKWYRRDEKEKAARQLEQLADRTERLVKQLKEAKCPTT